MHARTHTHTHTCALEADYEQMHVMHSCTNVRCAMRIRRTLGEARVQSGKGLSEGLGVCYTHGLGCRFKLVHAVEQFHQLFNKLMTL